MSLSGGLEHHRPGAMVAIAAFWCQRFVFMAERTSSIGSINLHVDTHEENQHLLFQELTQMCSYASGCSIMSSKDFK